MALLEVHGTVIKRAPGKTGASGTTGDRTRLGETELTQHFELAAPGLNSLLLDSRSIAEGADNATTTRS
jgi:hypothetical protein